MRSEPGIQPRYLNALRMLWFLCAAAFVVQFVGLERDATSAVLEYKVRALVVLLVGAGAFGWWWGRRRSVSWGFELVPAMVGAIAGMALVSALAGTDYAPGGLQNDASFRTAAVTRFADTWRNADFTVEGLPSFYPPAYFWLLGRAAALLGAAPWTMLKVGSVLTALVVPMLAFVLWRRIVPERVAALFSVVVLAVDNFYEPYSWLVMVAIVPWWLEAVHGLRREGAPAANPVVLGLGGALLALTYWYFFAIALIAFALHLLGRRVEARLDAADEAEDVDELDDADVVLDARVGRRRLAIIAGVTVVGSAVYWLPLVVSVLRADHPESLTSKWFHAGHTELPLPMLDNTAVGVMAMLGFVYLVWNVRRDPVARGLVCFLAAAYVWYLVGALAAIHRHPLLSFRGKPMIPLVLLYGGALALIRLGELAASRWKGHDVRRVTVALAVVIGVYLGQGFVSDVRRSSLAEAALATPRPEMSPPDPAATDLQQLVESFVGEHATLLSQRVDILVLYPNYAFVPWNAHYAHPASEFTERIEFLNQLAASADAQQFARRATDNRFGTIDAFVLTLDPHSSGGEDEGEAETDADDELVWAYSADDFPHGTKAGEVRFPLALFAEFELIPVGDHILAVRRQPG